MRYGCASGHSGKVLVEKRWCTSASAETHARVLQVLVVLADLVGQQQALVDDRAAAHARHVVLAAVRELERLDRARGRLADHVELALERVGHDHVGAAADEDLADHRLLGAHRRRHRHLAVDRHVAPAEQHLAFGRTARSSSCSQARREACSLGRKIMPTPYSPGGGSVDALRRHLGAVELVGDLDQDAGAVAHQLVGADRAAVVEVLQDLQALLDDRVRLSALDVGDEADAAGVVLVDRTVQALALGLRPTLRATRPALPRIHPWRAPAPLSRNEEYRSAAIPIPADGRIRAPPRAGRR